MAKDKIKTKQEKKARRAGRVRARIKGTAEMPRLSVFRSNKHIFLQLINDEKRKTIASVGDLNVKGKTGSQKMTKTKKAYEIGMKMAELAKTKKIKNVVFDRGSYKYHGRVKAAADGAREGGLKF